MLAAHAAAATCPRCNRRVRTGIELQAVAADLDDRLVALEPLRQSVYSDDQELHEAARSLIVHHGHCLQAELRGEHLDCDDSGLDDVFLAIALARAAECAARRRTLVQ